MQIDYDLEASAALQMLLDEAEQQQQASRTTATERKAAHQAAITDSDLDHLMTVHEIMTKVVDQITANKLDLDNLGLLTPAELFDLMVEFLAERDVKELLDIRYQMLRSAIFAHITEQNRQAGVADPERAPGEVPVPRLAKKWTREGGKMKAQLDEEKLKELLGERSEQVFTATTVPAVTIPEHVEYVLDEEKIVALVAEDPSVLEVFRQCVVPGYSPLRLHVRELRS